MKERYGTKIEPYGCPGAVRYYFLCGFIEVFGRAIFRVEKEFGARGSGDMSVFLFLTDPI